MSNIFFFSIPAWGHTNPTLPVAAKLVQRGHQVRYYSFKPFEEKIRQTGAEFVCCDEFLPELAPVQERRMRKISTTEMTLSDLELTRRLDPLLSRDIETLRPDCIVSDSVCFWGKLIAGKYRLPFVCSTTTFAFNRYSSRYMKNSFREMADTLLGLPRVNRRLKQLEPLGYHVKSALSLVQNDNDTNTIVYTSKAFQPCAETFSGHYAFIGPSVRKPEAAPRPNRRPQIYISMGTVLIDQTRFYKSCIEALKDMDADVILSVGKDTNLEAFQNLPENTTVFPTVSQMDVLVNTDVFITHCGMNSVSESLYMGVPLLLFPQTGEQKAVARRVFEVGAGIYPENTSPEKLRTAVQKLLTDSVYRTAARSIQKDFRSCSGAAGGAEFVEKVIRAGEGQR